MRPLMLLILAACGAPAQAGDLWLNLDHTGSTDAIKLHLPGNWLASSEEPVWIDTADGRVDLRQQAIELQKKKVGSSLTWRLDKDGGPVTVGLETLALSGTPAKSLGIKTAGPKGNGLTMTMDLTPDQLGQATGHINGIVDVNGLKFDLNKAMCDQLKASPPVTLVQTTGPKGGGITIDSR